MSDDLRAVLAHGDPTIFYLLGLICGVGLTCMVLMAVHYSPWLLLPALAGITANGLAMYGFRQRLVLLRGH